MNTLVGLINSVRQKCTHSWLTPSQLAVYHALRSGFDHQRILNLHGQVGVGKTVLAWVLEREGYGQYCPDAKDLPIGQRRILLDNCTASRKIRKIIDDMDDLHISQAVVITPKRIDDDFPSFCLELTPVDVLHCKATLSQELGVRFCDETHPINLHDLVRFLT